MNAKLNISKNGIFVTLLLIVVIALAVLAVFRFEGELPGAVLDQKAPAIGSSQPLTVHLSDVKSGLRSIAVKVLRDDKETTLFEKSFPSAGFWAGGSVHEETVKIPLDLQKNGLKDGKAQLRLIVRDWSWRRWWHGNQTLLEKEIVIDTLAPQIEVLSQSHYVTQGGAGLVVYRLAEPCSSSGVMVGKVFYPGFPGNFPDAQIHLAFLAVAFDQDPQTPLSVVATDLAGNQSTSRLPQSRIHAKKFKQDTLTISDQFLDTKMPEFRAQVNAPANATSLDIFMKVNGELRKANYETIQRITSRSDGQMHWHGEFLRLPASAPRAGFADHRSYLHQSKLIDEQTHMGVDLASLEQSPIPAANTGKVVFAEGLGIYGRSVIIDHGLGVFSMYSHLSYIDVTLGQTVQKGDIIGKTGTTGLAGGDHLHFSMLIHNTFVNPIEWWDPHWINDNVLGKLPSTKKSQ